MYLLIFSPFVYIFGTYTLLILQITGLLFGGFGIYKFFMLKDNNNERIAIFAMLYFFLFFGVFSALSYDYHSVVIAASLIPWFYYLFYKRNYFLSSIVVLLILISQENISLLTLFIFLSLLIEFRKDRFSLLVLLIYSLISLFYFVIVINVIIPSFSPTNSYNGFMYSVLGKTPLDALINIVLHPIENFKIMFINHNNSLFGDYVKIETHIILLLSGVFMLFIKPQYLLILIPIYGQKFFHDNYLMWSVGGQYSIEFAPIMAIWIFTVISEFKNIKLKNIIAIIVLIGCLASTIRIMDHTVFFTNKSAIRFYKEAHYKRNYDVKNVHNQLSLIPKNAKVSAQTVFVPHLALRNNIYQFPIIKDAEYVVFSTKESSYPLNESDFFKEINMLLNSEIWETKYKNEHFTILKKICL